jgi:hypothetical protein
MGHETPTFEVWDAAVVFRTPQANPASNSYRPPAASSDAALLLAIQTVADNLIENEIRLDSEAISIFARHRLDLYE